MSRRPSSILRLTRALVGLITVWCLGCSAYEPIVEWLGAGCAAPARCDEMPHGAATLSDNGASAGDVIGPVGTVSAAEAGYDCCGSGLCHAVTLECVASSAATYHKAPQMHELPRELASISRTPLLPPPQRSI